MKKLNLLLVIAAFTFILGGAFLNGQSQKSSNQKPPVGVQFKGAKGFTIYNVSLDMKKDPWLAAIKKDGLVWENHVSDLGGWGSKAAALYGINSIPANFLIDANGVILAKNLRGPALDAEIEKLIKN